MSLPIHISASFAAHLQGRLSAKLLRPSFDNRFFIATSEHWLEWVLVISALYFLFQLLRWIWLASNPLARVML